MTTVELVRLTLAGETEASEDLVDGQVAGHYRRHFRFSTQTRELLAQACNLMTDPLLLEYLPFDFKKGKKLIRSANLLGEN